MKSLAATIFVVLCLVSPAFAGCADMPSPVRDYIRAHPDWHLRVLEDLDEYDRAEWRKYEGGACPGFATVNMDGKGRAYAVLLARPASKGEEQRTVLLGGPGSKERLIESFATTVPLVTYRIPPGSYRDQHYLRRLHFQHDGLVVRSWGAFATGYYFQNGGLKKFTLFE
jgi:hypothetical protein